MSRRHKPLPPVSHGTGASAPANFVAVVSLGCPKNQVDAENLLGKLLARDVVLCPDPADASVIIVNTCGFIAPAREEGAKVLADCIALRHSGPCRRLIVAGCWVERDEKELRTRFPEVDVWAGLLTPERIAWVIKQALAGEPSSGVAGQSPATHGHKGGGAPTRRLGAEKLRDESARFRLTPGHWAYLRIADGCDNRCAYCTIPEIRGCLRSKSAPVVLAEARKLAAEGVREVCLIAQDITAYGHDLDGKSHLASLLGELARIDGIEWIRLLYTHPAHFTDDVIDAMASEPKVCRYVDLPIQHISDSVLSRMGRGIGRAGVESLVACLRAKVPGLVIRTTVLVGFPGETEADFLELCNFLRAARFERLGCFAYSVEPGTPAASMADAVPEPERRRRAEEIMRLQQRIAFEIADSWGGREVPVILDAAVEKPKGFIGRTYGDAPEIDPVVRLAGAGRVGEIARARIVRREGYDLVGKLLLRP